MSLLSTVETTAGGASTGPVGALAGFLSSVLPSLGPKYTKATHVQRCVAAMQSGDDQLAGTLIDQAIYHGWVQTGISDATDWRGITASIYQQATPKWRNYIELVLDGAPMQYENVGTTVPSPSSISGVTPGITTPTGSSLGQAISNFLGLPQTAQQAAVSGGQAAGSAVAKGIVIAALVIGAIVLVVVLLRRK